MNDNKKEEIASLNKLLREYSALAETQSIVEQKSYNMGQDYSDMGGLWNEEERALIDLQSLKNLFKDENWVYVVCDLVALKISSQPMEVCRRYKDADGNEAIEPVPEHPLQKTINNPNSYQDYHAFMYCVAVDLVLMGNGIIWKGPLGQTLFHLPANQILLTFDKEQNLAGYRRYNYVVYEQPKILTGTYNVGEIIHAKRPDPDVMFWGLSPFFPGRKSVLFNRFTSEYLNNYYLKGATSGFALEMTTEANEHNALRLLRSFEAAYTGRKNQRRTMVLPKGITAKQVAATLADQQLKDYVILNREDVLALLKVPKHEVGLQTAGSLGSEEYKTALKNFWSSTIIPMQNIIAGEFNRAYKLLLGEMFFVRFNNDDVEILKENDLEKANLAEKMLRTHTLNEIRTKLYSLPPLDGGDALPGVSQFQNSPFGFSMPIEASKSVDSQPSDEKKNEIVEIKDTAADLLIKANGDWFERHKREIAKAVNDPMIKIADLAVNLFADQAEAIIKKLPKMMPKVKAKKPEESSKEEKFIKELIAKEVAGYLSDWVNNYKNIANGVSIAGYVLGQDLPIRLEENLPEISDAAKKEMKESLDERSRRTFELMNEKTTNDVYKLIRRGIDRSDTVQQIAKEIAGVYSNADKIMYRADRIARTESLGALSIGQNKLMKDAAKTIPDLKKLWISTEDNRTRGNPSGLYKDSKCDHWGLHGQVVNHDDSFKEPRTGEMLSFPRDPGGSAANVINCRCTFIILPAKEMQQFQRNESEARPNA
jgi:HK97 family phage portal protein